MAAKLRDFFFIIVNLILISCLSLILTQLDFAENLTVFAKVRARETGRVEWKVPGGSVRSEMILEGRKEQVGSRGHQQSVRLMCPM